MSIKLLNPALSVSVKLVFLSSNTTISKMYKSKNLSAQMLVNLKLFLEAIDNAAGSRITKIINLG